MTNDEMKKILDRMIEATHTLNGFFYDQPIKPKPGGPVTTEDLARLDTYLAEKGFKVPAAYRAFLSIYDGIERIFDRKYSLLSAAGVITAGQYIIQELAEEFPACSQFVIGGGNTPDFTGFDINTSQGGGDYEVVMISGDTSTWRAENFEAFLTGYLAIVERNIRSQEEDRKNLAP